ncbi:MAG: HAMP domain-containing protein, partial [Lachnospiraceae bacterium]|nr:HAMP domain-containing protein [Lachnospiraceae bacterium]
MKFRYKVLIINILLLSITLGIVGYIILNRSYELALNTQIENAVLENNLAESSIEYYLLEILNHSTYNMESNLERIAGQVYAGMMSDTTDMVILYSNEIVFASREDIYIPSELNRQSEESLKNYILTEDNGRLYIYITNFCNVNDGMMNIITGRDISSLSQFLSKSISDYRNMSLIIILAATLIIYIISYLLTGPLEKLNSVTDAFAEGNYHERSTVKGNDEVGLLSDKFNEM